MYRPVAINATATKDRALCRLVALASARPRSLIPDLSPMFANPRGRCHPTQRRPSRTVNSPTSMFSCNLGPKPRRQTKSHCCTNSMAAPLGLYNQAFTLLMQALVSNSSERTQIRVSDLLSLGSGVTLTLTQGAFCCQVTARPCVFFFRKPPLASKRGLEPNHPFSSHCQK